jgi:hypothetical protein
MMFVLKEGSKKWALLVSLLLKNVNKSGMCTLQGDYLRLFLDDFLIPHRAENHNY